MQLHHFFIQKYFKKQLVVIADSWQCVNGPSVLNWPKWHILEQESLADARVVGYSRSSKAALFDRVHTTLYSSSIVTIPIYPAVCRNCTGLIRYRTPLHHTFVTLTSLHAARLTRWHIKIIQFPYATYTDYIFSLTVNLGIRFQSSDDHNQTDIIRVPANSAPLHFCNDIRFCSSPRNVRLGSLRRYTSTHINHIVYC